MSKRRAEARATRGKFQIVELDGSAALPTMPPVMITASVKLTEEQMAELRGCAHEKRMTISDYLRAALFPAGGRPKQRVIVKSPISGMPVDATPGTRINQEMVKEALADYP